MSKQVKSIITLFFLTFIFHSAATYAAELKGKVGQYGAYFTDSESLRHNRFELYLGQSTNFGYRFSTLIQARFRYDLALVRQEYSELDSSVRDDELSEGELRQAYLSYLGDTFKLSAGRQIIDWMDNLAVNTNDLLTPLDLRHGSFGDANQVVEPITAFTLNHKLGRSTLEWLISPEANHSRIPKEENGYGFYQRIREEAGRISTTVQRAEGEATLENAEAALRLMTNTDALEWTVLGWYGHQRSPVAEWYQESGRRATLTLTHPRVTTIGTALSLARDSYVIRASLFYQPDRRPLVVEIIDSAKNDVYVTRARLGLGLDYVFSQHLKLYSDHFAVNDKTRGSEIFLPPGESKNTTGYIHTIRLANESISGVEITLDALVTHPERGHILIPRVKWFTDNNFEWELGARLIDSAAEETALGLLQRADQYYLSFYYNFNISSEQY